MRKVHDHSEATHSAICHEKDCGYVAMVHAHDDEWGAVGLSHALSDHLKTSHKIKTKPEDILDKVKRLVKKLV